MIPWRKGLPPRALLRAHLQTDPCDPEHEVAVFDVQERGQHARLYVTFTDGAAVWTVRPPVKSTVPRGGMPVTSPSETARFRPVDVVSGEPRPWQDPPSGGVFVVLQRAARDGGFYKATAHVRYWKESAETATERGWFTVTGDRYQLTDDGRAALARVEAEKANES